MNLEKSFDPHNPDYKKVEDLPRAFRGDFVNTEEETGFVRKEADEHFMAAERQADQNIRYGEIEGHTAIEIMHGEAIDFEKLLSKIISEKKFDGIKEKREVPIKGWAKLGFITDSSTPSSPIIKADKEVKEVDVTNELYEKGAIDKNFFTRLVDAGVIFTLRQYHKTESPFPAELRNDKEFLLSLAKNTETEISTACLSEKLQQDNDFLLELVEVSQNFDHDNKKKVLETYFNGKNGIYVLDYVNKTKLSNEHRQATTIYKYLLTKFKDDESINDIVEAILKKDFRMATWIDNIAKSREMTDKALSVLGEMPYEQVKEAIEGLKKRRAYEAGEGK